MDVKIGMNMLLWGAETNKSHIPVIEAIARAGFDGVEVSVVGQAEADLAAIRSAAQSLGLSLTASTFVTRKPTLYPQTPVTVELPWIT